MNLSQCPIIWFLPLYPTNTISSELNFPSIMSPRDDIPERWDPVGYSIIQFFPWIFPPGKLPWESVRRWRNSTATDAPLDWYHARPDRYVSLQPVIILFTSLQMEYRNSKMQSVWRQTGMSPLCIVFYSIVLTRKVLVNPVLPSLTHFPPDLHILKYYY